MNRRTLSGIVFLLLGVAAPCTRAAEYVDQVIRYHNPAAGDATIVWGIGDAWDRLPRGQWPPGTFVFRRHMNTPMARTADGLFEMSARVPRGAQVGAVFYLRSRSDGTAVREVWDSRPIGQEAGTYTFRATGEPVVLEGRTSLLKHAKRAATMRRVAAYFAFGVTCIALAAVVLRMIPFERHRHAAAIAMVLITVLGLAVRLAWVMIQNAELGNAPQRLVGDEPGYQQMAVQLLRGEFYTWPGRMPLYSTFLAACYTVFGDKEAFSQVAIVQAVLTSTVIVLTYVLARFYVGVRGALLAALLMAVLPSQVEAVHRLMSETLYGPLLLAAIVLLAWGFDRPSHGRFALAGAAMGVAALCRPNGAYLFVILGLVPLLCRDWPLRRRFLLPATYVAALALVLAPWTLHNWRTFHRFMPLTVPGSTVWQGSPEYYRMIRDDGRSLTDVFGEELNPQKNGGRNIFSIEGSAYFTRRGVDSIRAEPALYVKYSILKAIYFWVGSPHADWPRLKMFDPYEWATFAGARIIAATFASRLFPFAGLLALGWLAYRRQLKPAWLVVAILAYFTAFHGLLYAEVRYSVPLQPLLAALIGMACAPWLDRRAHAVDAAAAVA